MAYKWIRTGQSVRRLADNASIPASDENSDWRECQRWVAQGNTIQPEDPPPPPLTADEHEQIAAGALNGGDYRADLMRLLKAKFISDLAFRLGKAPGALTPAELQAERTRIANIYRNI